MPEGKTSKKIILGRKREDAALKLRLKGYTYARIASELGISEAGAYAAVKRALNRLNENINEEAKNVRRLELERLDMMLANLWPKVEAGRESAIDRVLRIMERRSKLLGLDAPTRADVTTGGEKLPGATPSREEIRAALEEELARLMELRQLVEGESVTTTADIEGDGG